MSTSHGWIKLYRCLLDDPLWQCGTNEQKIILITLLLMANHAEKKWQWQGKPYICKPGQMITSAQSIAQKAGPNISRQNVRTSLQRFEKMGFLTIQATKQNTLITICNWETYQSSDTPANPAANHQLTKDSPTSNHQLTTNKNVKNVKNEKNLSPGEKDSFKPETIEDMAGDPAIAAIIRKRKEYEDQRDRNIQLSQTRNSNPLAPVDTQPR